MVACSFKTGNAGCTGIVMLLLLMISRVPRDGIDDDDDDDSSDGGGNDDDEDEEDEGRS